MPDLQLHTTCDPRRARPRLFALLTVVLALPVGTAAQAPPTPRAFPAADDATRQEVARELQSAVDAFNRGDLAGYMALYADLPDLVYAYRGEVLVGYASVRRDFASKFFVGVPASGRPPADQVVARLWRVDALGNGDLLATVTVAAPTESAAQDAAAGASSLVFRRLGGRWRVIYEHTS